MTSKQTKIELFFELARPNAAGETRWVSVDEFVGKYSPLVFNNGRDWARDDGSLAKKFRIDVDKSVTKGPRVDKIRLIGKNVEVSFNQSIRADIRKKLENRNCVILGLKGKHNLKIEIDHKNGRKDDLRVGNTKTQNVDDFQPLSKAANDAKRQICKECKTSNKRWNAKNLPGNPYDFYEGSEVFTNEIGCKGCYWYDPVEYRKTSVKRIAEEASANTADYIFNKLYPEADS